MRSLAHRARSGQGRPAESDEESNRVVLHSFRSRSDRVIEMALHTYRERNYLDLSTVEVLPGGGRGPIRRLSIGTHLFLEFCNGVRALEAELRRRGEV